MREHGDNVIKSVEAPQGRQNTPAYTPDHESGILVMQNAGKRTAVRDTVLREFAVNEPLAKIVILPVVPDRIKTLVLQVSHHLRAEAAGQHAPIGRYKTLIEADRTFFCRNEWLVLSCADFFHVKLGQDFADIAGNFGITRAG